jgi:hypothetical protein
MRVQASRRKPESIDSAVDSDAPAPHLAERSMLGKPNVGSPGPAWPKVAPLATQAEAPAASADRRKKKHLSECGINSHYTAFETRLSKQA